MQKKKKSKIRLIRTRDCTAFHTVCPVKINRVLIQDSPQYPISILSYPPLEAGNIFNLLQLLLLQPSYGDKLTFDRKKKCTLRFLGRWEYCPSLAKAVWVLLPQDAPARRSLRRPRGVPAAAAEPQRAGERRGPRGQNAAHDGSSQRARGRRR